MASKHHHHTHNNEANDDDENTTPKLPLHSLPPLLQSPECDHHGLESQTQPFYTLQASVPFQWEEQPGKPFPVEGGRPNPTTLDIKSLDLPPRLLKASSRPRDRTPSPTTVLEGPYRYLLESSSFRFLKKRQQRVSFYDGSVSFSGVRDSSPNRGLLGALIVSENTSKSDSWRKSGHFSFKGVSEVDEKDLEFSNSDRGGSHSGGDGVEMSRKGNRLSLSLAKPHFWGTIYSALKHVIPSRSTKWRKDGV